ncbi:hypothetical protein L7F22_026013 [Adiantum nelumboides]|nr:hypothetical protein [Adiantum nelumboides]
MEPDAKKPRLHGCRALLERIVSCTPVQAQGLADPQVCTSLPFPSFIVPERFSVEGPDRRFTYMGRTGYAEFVEKVLRLSPRFISYDLKELPVGPEKRSHFQIANLWGTMGSGKSFMLAALACDLLTRFSFTRRIGDIQQRQRVCYIPDCQLLLQSPNVKILTVQDALGLAYADDDEVLPRVASISDDASAIAFFEDEAKNGVLIYLLVDQVNAFENSQKDSQEQQRIKCYLLSFLHSLGAMHVIVKSASANNNNAQEWYRKQLNQDVMFHHGGLDDEEYASWKIHFSAFYGQPTPLAKLTEDEELRVKDATGCVPLFLRCWSNSHDSPSDAWQLFIKSREIIAAGEDLPIYIKNQLHNEEHLQQHRLDMYLQFMTGGAVIATPKSYDCRYLYFDFPSGTGRCVCGVYRDLIAQTLQMHCKSVISQRQWQTVISREVDKQNPNPSVLGFMIEQEMISEILQNGVPLYGKKIMKCTSISYFESGQEKHLPIQEGCVLYVPHAFNYGRVDAVIRQYSVSGKDVYNGTSPPDPKDLTKIYHELQLQVAGLQITLGSLASHLKSETQFCSPEALKVWCPNKDLKDVGKWFIWYVLQSEMDNHTPNAEVLAPFMYASKAITGRTRASRIQEVDHVTRFYALEDYEPILKRLRRVLDAKK